MSMTSWNSTAAVLAIGMLATNHAWSGEDHIHASHDHSRHIPTAVAIKPSGAMVKLPDTVLIDQNDRRLRLLTEVVADKVVVVSFLYTSCTTTCPVVSHLFSQVQERLGALLDSQVRLISLTVDPVRDTPWRLKAYSAQHDARPGWFWLTGQVANVTEALKAFGTYTANFENHPAVIMVGDGRNGKWTRIYGFEDPDSLVRKTLELLAARDAGTGDPTSKE